MIKTFTCKKCNKKDTSVHLYVPYGAICDECVNKYKIYNIIKCE